MTSVFVPLNKADTERAVPLTSRDLFPRALPKKEEQLLTASLRFDVAASGDLPDGMAADSQLVQNDPPANSAVPTISGTAQEDETLTATNGTWTGSPAGYSYDWQTSADGLAGWTSLTAGNGLATYVVTTNDVDQYLRVVVTAASATGSASAASAATAQVIAAT